MGCETTSVSYTHLDVYKRQDYSRVLRMRDGILERSLVYTTPGGKQMRIQISRFVSFRWKNIMEIRYCVTPLNFSGELTFVTGIEGNVENHTRKTNPIVDYGLSLIHILISSLYR